jgi:hypothetical protein
MAVLANEQGCDFDVEVTVDGFPLMEYECDDHKQSKKSHHIVKYVECKPDENFSIHLAVKRRKSFQQGYGITAKAYIDGRYRRGQPLFMFTKSEPKCQEIDGIENRINGVEMLRKFKFNSLKVGEC